MNRAMDLRSDNLVFACCTSSGSVCVVCSRVESGMRAALMIGHSGTL